ncbi:MAG: Fe(2+) transporter permease subunit FeoB, partial [SAR324 cluster bacterium]|nr:Fe(2+) transporter permease subunit FeoB [SAR324 cluster bacterium]
NCGKTTLFNKLTGIHQTVGNWPGVTVERKSGDFSIGGQEVSVIDLPGTYSLNPTSLDEQVARDYAISGEPDLILNIIDATNLERSLYLTLQLMEMKIPTVIVLNFMDQLEKLEIVLDQALLSKSLGLPVVPLVASQGRGLDALFELLKENPSDFKATPVHRFNEQVNHLVFEAIGLFKENPPDLIKELHPWLALKIVEEDPIACAQVDESIQTWSKEQALKYEEKNGVEIHNQIAEARIDWIGDTVTHVIKHPEVSPKALSNQIDKIVLNRFLGVPIFLFAMYLVFMISINVSAPFIDFINQVSGYFLVDRFGLFIEQTTGIPFFRTLLADGFGGGVQTVLTFIPPIGLMFLCLSVLEDSGYMARASFVLDRSIRRIGLPGRAVVPMIVGFGCSVPAIMSCRILSEQRDRRITLAMVPFMSCGAKLPVYALFAAAFFPSQGQNIVFALYLIGIVAAIFTGMVLKKVLFEGQPSPLLIELPAYHLPSLQSTLATTWQKLKRFILEAGKLIVIIVAVLTVMNSVNFKGDSASSGDSVLAEISKAITPIFYSIGIKDDNWPATVGIFTGIFAKEAIIGTLSSIYSTMASEVAENQNPVLPTLSETMKSAFSNLAAGLSKVLNQWLDPLGLNISFIENPDALEILEIKKSAFGLMAKSFDGQSGAFSYLIWVLLYAPCAAAVAALRRETDFRWTLFTVIYMTGLAWVASTLFYQLSHIAGRPLEALSWSGAALVVFLSLIFGLKSYGRKLLQLPEDFAVAPSCNHCSNATCH